MITFDYSITFIMVGIFLSIVIVISLVYFSNHTVSYSREKLPKQTKLNLPEKINFQISSNDEYGIGTFALDLVTGFGHGRTKNAQYNYEIQYHSYALEFNRYIDLQTRINNNLNQLGEYTFLIIQELEKTQQLTNKSKNRKLIYKNNNITKVMENNILTLKATTQTKTDTGIVLLQGSAIGGLAALGSWTLVSLFGTASTGTAISTLSGAAAYNATLAWFGGGAVAFGGGGMAAGAMTLVDITGISILIYCSYKSHSKANEIIKQTELLIPEINKLNKNNNYLEKFEISTHEQIFILKKKFEKIKNVNNILENILYPYGAFSVIRRNISEVFNQDFYTKQEYEKMSNLINIIDETYTFLLNNK